MIELRNISVTYGDEDASVSALKEVNLMINKGEFVTITGKSGCGKTTLLNILGAILAPDTGSYLFGSRDISGLKDSELSEFRNQTISFVVQHFALIQDRTVFDNIVLPLKYRKPKVKINEKEVLSVMQELGIRNKRYKYPYQLSGGEKQRVALCRSIIADTEVILADEPTGALDEETGHSIVELLKKLNDAGKTIIMVTHDPELAKLGTRKIVMKDGMILSNEVNFSG